MPSNTQPADSDLPDEKVTGKRVDQQPNVEMQRAPVKTIDDAGPSDEPMKTPEDAEPAEDVERVTTVDGNDGVTREFPEQPPRR